jgi:hypothetical protein
MYIQKTGITQCQQYLVNASGHYYKQPAIHLSRLRDCKTQLTYNIPHRLDSRYEDLCQCNIWINEFLKQREEDDSTTSP